MITSVAAGVNSGLLIQYYAVSDAAVHRSWMGYCTRATPATMCSPTALIGRPKIEAQLRTSIDGPIASTIDFQHWWPISSGAN